VWTIDRNANQEVQDYFADMYDINFIREEQTATQVIGAGSATARAQYYGSYENRSLWVNGMFDYRALSDYVPVKADVFLYEKQCSMGYGINITNDVTLEVPDEDFLVTISQPGEISILALSWYS